MSEGVVPSSPTDPLSQAWTFGDTGLTCLYVIITGPGSEYQEQNRTWHSRFQAGSFTSETSLALSGGLLHKLKQAPSAN